MLKLTGIELAFLTDMEMILFMKKVFEVVYRNALIDKQKQIIRLWGGFWFKK